MRRTQFALLLFCILAIPVAAQSDNSSNPVLTASILGRHGTYITKSCLTVYFDKGYRLERQGLELGDKPSGKVLDGTLSDQSFHEIDSMLGSDEFKALATPEAKSDTGHSQDLDVWEIIVPRPDKAQRLTYVSRAQQRAEPPKPFMAWFKAVQKQKAQENKSAPNHCTIQVSQGE
jgi:hypothetical protein